MLAGAEVAVQEGPNTELPSHPQPAESVGGGGSPTAKDSVSPGAGTGGEFVCDGGGRDVTVCLFPSAGLERSSARVEPWLSTQ